MTLKTLALINILVSAIVGGMYWGPWLALTRSLKKFGPGVFLPVVRQLNLNMGPLMTVLSPLSLITAIPVLILSYHDQHSTFCFTLTGLFFFLLALAVTVMIEVPLVKQMITWTETTLPENWQQIRDRWGKFHWVRVMAGIAGLSFYMAGILF